tara:strand:+ start:336 stop:551 length:216 start_codon:yes stop_codon:yes gene_type:complete
MSITSVSIVGAMAELVDAPVLGTGLARGEGSSPSLAYHWSKNGYNDGYKTVFIDTMGEERSVGSQRFCKIR